MVGLILGLTAGITVGILIYLIAANVIGGSQHDL